MIRLYYEDDALVRFSDFGLQEYVNTLCEKYGSSEFTNILSTSTENAIYAFRVAIKRGMLKADDFELVYEDKTITFDNNGTAINGYISETFIDNALDILLGLKP